MAIDRSGIQGWKKRLMALFDRFLFSFPYLTELINQVASKNMGILAAWHFLSRTEVEGDYFEFGVFRGETFRNAIRASHQAYRLTKEGRYNGRFFAFDSFEGLPDVPSLKETNNIYAKGEFSASEQEFRRNVGKLMESNHVVISKGWFDKLLNDNLRGSLDVHKAAFVNIDVDLYESTVPILKFIQPLLQTGTVIYFDDWFSLKGSMNDGEPRACAEWLKANPYIRLIDYRSVGITGKMFVVNLVN